MAISWLRLWHDMPSDPKWRTIARVSKQPISAVIAVYINLLVIASNAGERGRTQSLCSEDLASALDLDTNQVDSILDAMQGRVLDGDMVSGWAKRQVEREDGSAERAKRWREAQKEASRTQPNATERNRTPDTDTDTDTDTEKKQDQKQKGGKPPALTLPDWLPESAWADWHAFRNSRKGWTHKARSLSLSTLTKLRAKGHDPTAVIEQSIERGWTGLFEPKNETGGNHEHANRSAGSQTSVVERIKANNAAADERERRVIHEGQFARSG